MRIVIIFFATLITGCVIGPNMAREKPGASRAEFDSTRYECIKSSSYRLDSGSVSANQMYQPGYRANASSKMVVSCQTYRACMDSKGYRLVPNGRFDAPVDCVE